jgi:hypothetical protein
MKLARILALLLIMLAVAALCGCLGPERKITATVGPSATVEPTVAPTPTPTPTPVASGITVSVSGDAVVIRGNAGGVSKGFSLGQGVYIVTWSGNGKNMSFWVKDRIGNEADISKGKTSGKRLLVVDDSSVYPGNFTLSTLADAGWVVTIERPDISSPTTLPVKISGSEEDGAVSVPFRMSAGDIKISYSFSRVPYADGHIYIYNVATGSSFYTRPMSSGTQVGQSNVGVPSDGIYIAQVDIAPGGSHGDITISQ